MEHDIQITAFTEEMNILQGKPCGDFENEERYEEEFELSCPIEIAFGMFTDKDGKKVMSHCEITKRWTPA